MKKLQQAFTWIITGCLSLPALGQGLIEAGPSPYEFITESWMKPFAAEGFTFGGTSSVVVESQDRIFILQRGETQLPDPLPPEYTTFAGSMGWNVLRGQGRVSVSNGLVRCAAGIKRQPACNHDAIGHRGRGWPITASSARAAACISGARTIARWPKASWRNVRRTICLSSRAGCYARRRFRRGHFMGLPVVR